MFFRAARAQIRVQRIRIGGVITGVNLLVSDEQREARLPLNRQRRLIDDRDANRLIRLVVAVRVFGVRAYGRYRRTFRIPDGYRECQRSRVAVGVRRRPSVRLGLRGRGWRAGNRPSRRRPRHPLRQRGGRKRVRQRAVSPRRSGQDDGRNRGVGVVEHIVHARGAERGRGVVHAHRRARGVPAGDGVAAQAQRRVIVLVVAHGRAHQAYRVHGNGGAVPVPVAFSDRVGEHRLISVGVGARVDGLGNVGVVSGFDRLIPYDERKAGLAADCQRGGVFDRQQDGIAGFIVAVRIRGDYGQAGYVRALRIPNRDMERQSRRIAVRVRRRPRVRLWRELRRRGAGNRPRRSRPRHPVRQRRGRENVIYRAIAARRFRQDDGRRGGVDVPQFVVDPRRAEAWGGVVDPMRRVV